ncbi:MAG TPA: Gfo/Idh/MocA family oxidoreductase [Polyangiaceae bacterium]
MRCLFFGLGSIGQRHVRNLRALYGKDVEIFAHRVRGERDVIDERMRIAPGECLEEKYGIQVFAEIERAFAAAPDVVFVTNPTSLHLSVAARAAEHGCHLFIEKPLADSLDGVDALARIVEEKRLVAFVAYQLRQHPAFRRIQKLLREDSLGRLCSVSFEVGEYLPGFHPYEDYRRSYASRSDLGGGVTITQIHEIDLMVALFGMPERVFSLGGQLSSLQIDVDDVASSLIQYRRRDGRVLPVHLHQDYLQKPPSRRCRLIGERGRVEWTLSTGGFVRFDEHGEIADSLDYQDYPRNQLFLDELGEFFACVRERRPAPIGVRDGARSLEIALALKESQRSGETVELTAGAAS